MLDITVCIPAHPARIRNGMLAEAINSAWSQTLTPAAISLAIDIHREGAAATRQRALDGVTTEWTAFLDSDDIFLPKHLEWLARHAISTGADFCYAWFRVLQQFADGRTNILEDDPVFPLSHYMNDWDPDDPIETTMTVLVRTELAKQVGFKPLDRGEANSGEDAYFTLGCAAAGAKISHLKRKSWLWRHAQLPDGTPLNTSGLPTKGDAAWVG